MNKLLKGKSGEEMSQSKISTRPSTRHQLRSSLEEGSLYWLASFSVFDDKAEEKLNNVKMKIMKENKTMIQAIEQLQREILDRKTEFDCHKKEAMDSLTSMTVMQKLSKKLEVIFRHSNLIGIISE